MVFQGQIYVSDEIAENIGYVEQIQGNIGQAKKILGNVGNIGPLTGLELEVS